MRRFLQWLLVKTPSHEAEIRRIVADVIATARARDHRTIPEPGSERSVVIAEIVGEYGRSIAVIGKTAVWTNQSGVC